MLCQRRCVNDQVYQCRLRETGELVALKVQRPDMLRAVSLDLYLLRNYMSFVDWFKARLPPACGANHTLSARHS